MTGNRIPAPEKNMLWAKSGNRCAFPNCPERLVQEQNEQDDRATTGEIAHIYGRSAKGPRPAPQEFPRSHLNRYENLILLCPNHHKTIDRQPETYTVEALLKMKESHERWITERRHRALFGSLELETIITWLANYSKMQPSSDYVLRPPRDKIEYNALSAPVESYVQSGLAKEYAVREFVEHQIVLDASFPVRLLMPLRARYDMSKSLGYDGDAIFYDLWLFAYGNKSEFSLHAAALAILSYYFVRCDIFEK